MIIHYQFMTFIIPVYFVFKILSRCLNRVKLMWVQHLHWELHYCHLCAWLLLLASIYKLLLFNAESVFSFSDLSHTTQHWYAYASLICLEVKSSHCPVKRWGQRGTELCHEVEDRLKFLLHSRAGERVQWTKASAAEPDKLSLIQGLKEKTNSTSFLLEFTCMPWYRHTHTNIHHIHTPLKLKPHYTPVSCFSIR